MTLNFENLATVVNPRVQEFQLETATMELALSYGVRVDLCGPLNLESFFRTSTIYLSTITIAIGVLAFPTGQTGFPKEESDWLPGFDDIFRGWETRSQMETLSTTFERLSLSALHLSSSLSILLHA